MPARVPLASVATADISDAQQVESAYLATMEKFGTVDVLVNNAGLRQRNLFPPTGKVTTLETQDSDWEKMFGVGVFGTLKVTRRFIQPMLERQSGSIISVISGGAMHTGTDGVYVAQRSSSREMPYQSAKAATLTMMFYLADEVKESNVAVNILIPGNSRTTGYDEQNEARREAGQSNRAIGRISMLPEHIVPITLFLAGQAAGGVENNPADGAYTDVGDSTDGDGKVTVKLLADGDPDAATQMHLVKAAVDDTTASGAAAIAAADVLATIEISVDLADTDTLTIEWTIDFD